MSRLINMLVGCALIGAAAHVNAQGDDTTPVAFQRQVGPWTIIGDPSVGTCLAFRQNEDRSARMAIAAKAAASTLTFALTNPAWKSLKDDDSFRIQATFTGANGKITDYWDLDALSTAEENGGPRINFDIERAANDRASFVNMFKRASSIWFWNGSVPVANFDLAGSSSMIDVLLQCRTSLRLDESFDPFARP